MPVICCEVCKFHNVVTFSNIHECTCRFQQFPPGHYFSSKTGEFTRYYNPQFYLDFEAQPPRTPSTPYDPRVLREAFEAAVEKRLMSDVPFGKLGDSADTLIVP